VPTLVAINASTSPRLGATTLSCSTKPRALTYQLADSKLGHHVDEGTNTYFNCRSAPAARSEESPSLRDLGGPFVTGTAGRRAVGGGRSLRSRHEREQKPPPRRRGGGLHLLKRSGGRRRRCFSSCSYRGRIFSEALGHLLVNSCVMFLRCRCPVATPAQGSSAAFDLACTPDRPGAKRLSAFCREEPRKARAQRDAAM